MLSNNLFLCNLTLRLNSIKITRDGVKSEGHITTSGAIRICTQSYTNYKTTLDIGNGR